MFAKEKHSIRLSPISSGQSSKLLERISACNVEDTRYDAALASVHEGDSICGELGIKWESTLPLRDAQRVVTIPQRKAWRNIGLAITRVLQILSTLNDRLHKIGDVSCESSNEGAVIHSDQDSMPSSGQRRNIWCGQWKRDECRELLWDRYSDLTMKLMALLWLIPGVKAEATYLDRVTYEPVSLLGIILGVIGKDYIEEAIASSHCLGSMLAVGPTTLGATRVLGTLLQAGLGAGGRRMLQISETGLKQKLRALAGGTAIGTIMQRSHSKYEYLEFIHVWATVAVIDPISGQRRWTKVTFENPSMLEHYLKSQANWRTVMGSVLGSILATIGVIGPNWHRDGVYWTDATRQYCLCTLISALGPWMGPLLHLATARSYTKPDSNLNAYHVLINGSYDSLVLDYAFKSGTGMCVVGGVKISTLAGVETRATCLIQHQGDYNANSTVFAPILTWLSILAVGASFVATTFWVNEATWSTVLFWAMLQCAGAGVFRVLRSFPEVYCVAPGCSGLDSTTEQLVEDIVREMNVGHDHVCCSHPEWLEQRALPIALWSVHEPQSTPEIIPCKLSQMVMTSAPVRYNMMRASLNPIEWTLVLLAILHDGYSTDLNQMQSAKGENIPWIREVIERLQALAQFSDKRAKWLADWFSEVEGHVQQLTGYSVGEHPQVVERMLVLFGLVTGISGYEAMENQVIELQARLEGSVSSTMRSLWPSISKRYYWRLRWLCSCISDKIGCKYAISDFKANAVLVLDGMDVHQTGVLPAPAYQYGGDGVSSDSASESQPLLSTVAFKHTYQHAASNLKTSAVLMLEEEAVPQTVGSPV
ncbi:uncharacterized protein VTP21DRAFT_6832 [Calcarisporiella thermophila]|uniref:uncharacterized protein n=1 Tax=Calcarisporiella thermophila TaxID=911321 RepID=UPI003742E4A0